MRDEMSKVELEFLVRGLERLADEFSDTDATLSQILSVLRLTRAYLDGLEKLTDAA